MRRVERGGLRLLEFSSLKHVEGLTCVVSTQPLDVRELDDARRLFEAVGADPERMVRVRQVHHADIAVVDTPPAERLEVDGLITNKPGQPLFLRAADCSLVVVVDEAKRAVGAAHAGWKGSARGVVVNLVKRMSERYGSDPKTLRAAVGPTVSWVNYPVGPEVPATFLRWRPWASEFVHVRGTQMHFDLAGANGRFLQEAGIPRERIEVVKMCTVDNRGLLHSYRHRGVDAGHHGIVVYWS